MQRIDLLIVTVLVVAVAGSALGVATYRDDRLGQLAVEWTTRATALESDAVAQTGAGDLELPLEVDLRNLTEVELVLRVAGSAARVQPVAIRVEVLVPGVNETFAREGALAQGPAAAEELTLTVDLTPVPTEATIAARSPEAALAALDARFGSDLGRGNWTVRVSLAPSAPGPLGEEDFTVQGRAEATTYAAEVASALPEVDAR